MLIDRMAGLMSFIQFGKQKTAKQIKEAASWFYFDTALSSGAGQLAALTRLAKPSHILFGIDYPNAPTPSIQHFRNMLKDSKELSEDAKAAMADAGTELFLRLSRKQ